MIKVLCNVHMIKATIFHFQNFIPAGCVNLMTN